MAYDSVVPLHIVDVLNRPINIDLLFQKAELAGKGNFSEHLDELSAGAGQGQGQRYTYIKSKIMQQISQIADSLVTRGVLLEVLHQQHDHILDWRRALLHLW